jgi:hypothetical protein
MLRSGIPVLFGLWGLFHSAAPYRADSPAPSLDWAIGHWHGVRREEGTKDERPLTVSVEKLPGMGGQMERLQVDLTARGYVGFTVRAVDGNGRWTMFYANSTRSGISRLEGAIEGARSTWESIHKDGTGSRFVSERRDADHWKRTQYRSAHNGKTWSVLFTDELERDKTPP